MKIINHKVLFSFIDKNRCELCGHAQRSGLDPHHLRSKGRGGENRMDIPINLISLCRMCHNKIHNGETSGIHVMTAVSEREGIHADCVEESLFAIERMSAKDSEYTLNAKIAVLDSRTAIVVGKMMLYRNCDCRHCLLAMPSD